MEKYLDEMTPEELGVYVKDVRKNFPAYKRNWRITACTIALPCMFLLMRLILTHTQNHTYPNGFEAAFMVVLGSVALILIQSCFTKLFRERMMEDLERKVNTQQVSL